MSVPWQADRPFAWRDGERTIHFGRGALEAVPSLLDGPFVLLTTPRARVQAPDLVALAETVHDVPAGTVDAVAGALRPEVRGGLLVALGGGRVIDVAKALAAADGPRTVAAVPTTLSGAEMTAIHRLAAGTPASRPRVRPALVVWDPALLDSLGVPGRAASAMNALGHAAEAPLTRRAGPLALLAAQAAVEYLERGLADGGTGDLALGAMLAGYAIGTAGYGLHHVLAQTLAREAGVPHGAANAVMLPHALVALERRFPGRADPGGRIARLAVDGARTAGVGRLRDLGVERAALPALARVAAARTELDETPPPASGDELEALYEAAW